MPGEINYDKDVFTTFEVAKICNANITSIKNWIEHNKIRAFRTPGGHYRIERAVLVDFLNRYGMPNPFTARDRKRVLIVGNDPGTVELVRRAVGRDHEVEGTDDGLEAALMVGARRPDCLVIDILMDGFDGEHLLKLIRKDTTFNNTRIVAYSDTDDTELENRIKDARSNTDQPLVNYFVRQGDGVEKLTEAVEISLI
ncbi:MAG: response regulator [Myxococcota bacterium]